MLPELSVEALQARLTESSVIAVICRFAGTVGAVASRGGRGRDSEVAGTARARTASAAHALTAGKRAFIGVPPLRRGTGPSPVYAHAHAPVLGSGVRVRRARSRRSEWRCPTASEPS